MGYLKYSQFIVESRLKDINMKIQIKNTILSATLTSNSSAAALLQLLEKGPITIKMQDYARMEKVGSLGVDLPRNDKRFTTKPGDIVLYEGSLLVIYYEPNTWNFTYLGKIDNISADELREILVPENLEMTLSK